MAQEKATEKATKILEEASNALETAFGDFKKSPSTLSLNNLHFALNTYKDKFEDKASLEGKRDSIFK